MYVVLLIALAALVLTWPLLRRYTQIWINRPISVRESILAGSAAWLFLLSLLLWFGGIVWTLIEFFSYHDIEDLLALIFSSLLTGYGFDFIVRSKGEMNLDDTKDFIKEAIQFRRSAQRRLDLIALMQLRQEKRISAVSNDPELLRRAKLQAELNKGKELETQLAILRGGETVEITDEWRGHAKTHLGNTMYEKVEQVKVDPTRKRLSIFFDFPELNEKELKDEMTVYRFNRQVYDFMQSVNADSWLKPYLPFFESYFLLCRGKRTNEKGAENFYPFMKVGILVSELRRLEGSYFNPRKLSEIATLAFNDGAQV